MTLKAMQNCLIIQRDIEKHPLFVLPLDDSGETGIVVSAGPDCKELKSGDHVYFGVGQEFAHGGTKYVVIREPHVLGVLNG
jgi:co-chaperonin GroES (HSP10)